MTRKRRRKKDKKKKKEKEKKKEKSKKGKGIMNSSSRITNLSAIDFGCNLGKMSNEEIQKFLDLHCSGGTEEVCTTGSDDNQMITGIVSISNNYKETLKNVKFIKDHFNLFCTVGIHPRFSADMKSFHEFKAFIMNSKNIFNKKVIAIGECGLDYNSPSPPETQRFVFNAQVEIAKQTNMPLYLHCREAFDDFFEILDKLNYSKGILHCFTGNYENLVQVLARKHLYIGISGYILNSGFAKKTIEALQSGIFPLERIIVETNYPFMSPPKYKLKEEELKQREKSFQTSKEGEIKTYITSFPKTDIFLIIKRLSDIYKVDIEQVASILYQNSFKIINQNKKPISI